MIPFCPNGGEESLDEPFHSECLLFITPMPGILFEQKLLHMLGQVGGLFISLGG